MIRLTRQDFSALRDSPFPNRLLDARDVRLLSRLSEEHGGDADRDERHTAEHHQPFEHHVAWRREEHGGLYGARPSSVTQR